MAESYWVETLGCPKNQVDSEKILGFLDSAGMTTAAEPAEADLVVVNTCAFVESAREESIDTILSLASQLKSSSSQLVVTGCMAERYGKELKAELPEVDAVVGFGVPVTLGAKSASAASDAPKPDLLPRMDLLNMSRPASELPWAYVKIAEGCDRKCGYCAIPQFRGPQRSRSIESICAEVEALEVREAVLIAQDLAAFGRDLDGQKQIIQLVKALSSQVDWVRLLYLYPSDLTDELAEAICATQVPYFDLSLQHVSRPLLRRMRRWGDSERFLARMSDVRTHEPQAVFRSNFIVGYPGETEQDHEQLLEFIEEAQLDWCAFFEFSPEEGTYAQNLDGQVPRELISERIAELRAAQETVSENLRLQLIGQQLEVLVDAPGTARSYREAPEIDGIIIVPKDLPAWEFAKGCGCHWS